MSGKERAGLPTKVTGGPAARPCLGGGWGTVPCPPAGAEHLLRSTPRSRVAKAGKRKERERDTVCVPVRRRGMLSLFSSPGTTPVVLPVYEWPGRCCCCTQLCAREGKGGSGEPGAQQCLERRESCPAEGIYLGVAGNEISAPRGCCRRSSLHLYGRVYYRPVVVFVPLKSGGVSISLLKCVSLSIPANSQCRR